MRIVVSNFVGLMFVIWLFVLAAIVANRWPRGCVGAPPEGSAEKVSPASLPSDQAELAVGECRIEKTVIIGADEICQVVAAITCQEEHALWRKKDIVFRESCEPSRRLVQDERPQP